jgi:hypothetical protein
MLRSLGAPQALGIVGDAARNEPPSPHRKPITQWRRLSGFTAATHSFTRSAVPYPRPADAAALINPQPHPRSDPAHLSAQLSQQLRRRRAWPLPRYDYSSGAMRLAFRRPRPRRPRNEAAIGGSFLITRAKKAAEASPDPPDTMLVRLQLLRHPRSTRRRAPTCRRVRTSIETEAAPRSIAGRPAVGVGAGRERVARQEPVRRSCHFRSSGPSSRIPRRAR